MNSKFQNITKFYDESANPMDGVSNMSDAMLVLAVGIMLALVINWKIDLGPHDSNLQIDTTKMEEFVEDAAQVTSDVSVDDLESNFVKAGTVYQDVDSGKTYIVIDK